MTTTSSSTAATATTAAPTATATNPGTNGDAATRRDGLAALTLAAIGIVYGDIGTSPLYTVKEIFAPAHGVALERANIVGAISCIFWALMLVVTLKYVLLVLRADNRGEGGALALTALATHAVAERPRLKAALLLLGVFAATFFYGDSVITPAVSVLGAMEGLKIAMPALGDVVVPITLVILALLFVVQRFGTAAVGKAFGPIVVLWFAVLAASGAIHVVAQPGILAALDPLQAVSFIAGQGPMVLLVIGAVVLAVTGAEALYADMGHFGRRPIQLAWTFVVLPSLAINYLGQGALLIGDPSAIENPFYRLFPPALIWPALVIATLAAIIASQATISGAYSMTRQAIQLGLLPRMTIRHTSAREQGQIYMPTVNWIMMIGVAAVVLAFGSASALAGAYGLSVTLTMLITTLLLAVVALRRWRLPLPAVVALVVPLLLLDSALVAGCAVKILDGGWFTLVLAAVLAFFITTWHRGRSLMFEATHADGVEIEGFIAALDHTRINRAERVAAYLVADPRHVPGALLHNLKHNQVLHECNLLVSVVFRDEPWVGMDDRVRVEPLGKGFWRVTIEFGFMNTPDVPKALLLCASHGLRVPPFETSWFISRETIVPTPGRGMAMWRERIYAAMMRNAGSVVEFFRLPDNGVVELGTRVQI
jgi:KUP system potassium uptake protein